MKKIIFLLILLMPLMVITQNTKTKSITFKKQYTISERDALALGVNDRVLIYVVDTDINEIQLWDGVTWAGLEGGVGGAVDSVNGQLGDVVLDADDIDDTSTTNKFATAQQLANIAINEGNITTNTTNISNNDTDITALQNNKQDNLTLTTNGTTGPAQLIGNTLNIPNYDTSGGTVDNTILTTSLTTDRTLAVSDINDFNIFTIDAVGLTLTIPQTTLATGEIKFITFLAPNESSFTVAGDTGVTVPSPATFSGLRVVTLYSTTEDVWLLYNSEEDAGGGISGVETQDEGIQVDADATTLNFVGAGVSATDAGNGVTTVTISGGGGGGFNQTTFNGQDVHFIKHPDNSASTFETGDFITNYVESDTLVQLAQFRGGAQSYANLDVVESLVISSRFDISIPVTGVSVLPASATLDVGQTQQLTETVAPANADDPSVTWSSDTPSVATVSSSGLVTAVSAGSATITVETTDGGFKDTSDITVNSAGTQLLSGDASSLVNEADSRGTWSNDFYNSTETVDTNGSTYAQETIGTTSFTNSDLTLSGLTIGDTIVIEFDAKCNTQNEQNVTLTDTSDNSSFWTNGSQPTTWTSYSRTVTVTATSFVFRVTGSAGGGQNGDIILIDNLSIIQQ